MTKNEGRIYLLINTEIGRERHVRDELRKLDHVKYADMITGRYDIIATLEGESVGDIFATVISNIRAIKGIIRTESNVVFE
ncbi:MAG: Lrp/AsnC ligand binding domain-containing protein [Nitrospirae bacterium]|nr:Lrp/AsnC ligand binding domain-containing protein [Nitrospirota bacterium]